MGFKFSNNTYDVLKRINMIILPALATLYFTLSSIWGFGGAEQVVGTTAAITTFLGITLGLSTRHYAEGDDRFDGDMVVSGDDSKKTFSLGLNTDPQNLLEKKEILFRVVSDETESH